MAGLLSLAFNPSAWIAVGLALFIGFSTGVVKGWSASNAGHWKEQAQEMARAAAQKEAIIKADADRAESDRSEIARLEATVEAIAHESRLATGSCQFSPVELERLQRLASGKR
jgi:hypothetical protein